MVQHRVLIDLSSFAWLEFVDSYFSLHHKSAFCVRVDLFLVWPSVSCLNNRGLFDKECVSFTLPVIGYGLITQNQPV